MTHAVAAVEERLAQKEFLESRMREHGLLAAAASVAGADSSSWRAVPDAVVLAAGAYTRPVSSST